jgi:hypothetical protein
MSAVLEMETKAGLKQTDEPKLRVPTRSTTVVQHASGGCCDAEFEVFFKEDGAIMHRLRYPEDAWQTVIKEQEAWLIHRVDPSKGTKS